MASHCNYRRGLETPDRRRILSDISNTPLALGLGKSTPVSALQRRLVLDQDHAPHGVRAPPPTPRRTDMFEVYEDCDMAKADLSATKPTAAAPPIISFGNRYSSAARPLEQWNDDIGRGGPDGFGTPTELVAMLERSIQQAQLQDEARDVSLWRQMQGLPTSDNGHRPEPPPSPEAMRWESESAELSPMKFSPMKLPDIHLDIDMGGFDF